jgi:DNA polymerase I-like protein with 3'-5' exonuclease and polymerase domains
VGLKRSNTGSQHSLDQVEESRLYNIEYSQAPYGVQLQAIKQEIESSDLLVGFNIKFDLHWIKKYVPIIRFPLVWDCQLAAFILGNQQESYPSLDGVASAYGLGSKLDVVERDYWSQGIDTDAVPEGTLRAYLEQDLNLTYQIYLKQRQEAIDKGKLALIELHCEDLLVLQEMEFNGLKFNQDKAHQLAREAEREVQSIDIKLNELFGSNSINFDSADHVSCILFGGHIRVDCQVSYEKTLKSGTVKTGTKKGFRLEYYEPICSPDKRSETLPTSKWDDFELSIINEDRDRQGKAPFCRIYSVDEDQLRSIRIKDKSKSKAVNLFLRRRELKKLGSTYYDGFNNRIRENEWPKDTLHGQFNQCVVRTGRLSSSKPNLQNPSGAIKDLFYTRT